MNLFKILSAAFKAKIVPIWTKFKLFMSKTFWQAKATTVIRNFFVKLFNVKPRDKKDYFTFRKWMISRRLAYAIVVSLGIISLVFIFAIAKPFGSKSAAKDGMKTYKYNSIFLKLVNGNVKIKAKDGHIAYVGHVDDGYATGEGKLYNKSGKLVYQGDFKESKFEGKGTQYYATGQAEYVGDFSNNQFNGEGTYFRMTGSKAYAGAFVNGLKEGTGKLYDTGNNVIFTGEFSRDELIYSQLLGKLPSEIASEYYSGSQMIYNYNDTTMIQLTDIDAIYINNNSDTSVEDEGQIEDVYVLKDSMIRGENVINNVTTLIDTLGDPEYEGNAYLTITEAVALHRLEEMESKKIGSLKSGLIYEKEFDEFATINSFHADEEVYIYAYNIEGITYTYYFTSKFGNLFMYSMSTY